MARKDNAAKAAQYKLAQRRAELALLLRRGYRNQRELGKILNVSPATINRDLKHLKQEWQQDGARDLNVALNSDLDTLNRTLQLMTDRLEKAKGYDDKAVAAIVSIISQRSRILGYEAAEKIDVSVQPAEITIIEIEKSYRSDKDDDS